jgi:glycosyltransferase involved in cell wall biosynthesis
MKLFFSVIICTHNPRHDYIDKVLMALQAQTLPLENWELLLIDNASESLLSSELDLTWHPQSRHIREEQLGLTPARLRGIKEATAETLVFVDDDNVLDSDYLKVALGISKDYQFLGAWGGQIRPEFEVPPPEWTKPYWKYLAIREFERDQWSNLLHQHQTTPCGAGLCVRKIVADKYAEIVNNDPKRLGLDRKGKLLMSSGDSDLAFTACDIGLGTGQFVNLKLTHLMPAIRLEEEYLVRLVEGLLYSNTILDSFRGKKISYSLKTSWIKKLYEFCKTLMMKPQDRRIYKARERAKALALQEMSTCKY